MASLHRGDRVAVFRDTLPPIAGAWLPNAAFVATLILLTRRTPNTEPRTPNGEPRTANLELSTEPEHELSTENREA